MSDYPSEFESDDKELVALLRDSNELLRIKLRGVRSRIATEEQKSDLKEVQERIHNAVEFVKKMVEAAGENEPLRSDLLWLKDILLPPCIPSATGGRRDETILFRGGPVSGRRISFDVATSFRLWMDGAEYRRTYYEDSAFVPATIYEAVAEKEMP